MAFSLFSLLAASFFLPLHTTFLLLTPAACGFFVFFPLQLLLSSYLFLPLSFCLLLLLVGFSLFPPPTAFSSYLFLPVFFCLLLLLLVFSLFSIPAAVFLLPLPTTFLLVTTADCGFFVSFPLQLLLSSYLFIPFFFCLLLLLVGFLLFYPPAASFLLPLPAIFLLLTPAAFLILFSSSCCFPLTSSLHFPFAYSCCLWRFPPFSFQLLLSSNHFLPFPFWLLLLIVVFFFPYSFSCCFPFSSCTFSLFSIFPCLSLKSVIWIDSWCLFILTHLPTMNYIHL